MGIQRKIKGVHGMMPNRLAKKMPAYIEAADTIAASAAVTPLLRCPGIRDGEKPACWTVDRAAIAQCMEDMIKDETLGANEKFGHHEREAVTEKMPSFILSSGS